MLSAREVEASRPQDELKRISPCWPLPPSESGHAMRGGILLLATFAGALAGCGQGEHGATTSGAGSSTGASTASSSSAGTASSGGGTTTGTGSGSSTTTGGTSTTGTTGATTTGGRIWNPDAGQHGLPIIPDHGGLVMGTTDVVTIQYPGVDLDLAAFTDYLLGSSWFSAVGSDYGVSAGRRLAHYLIPDAGPALLDPNGVVSIIDGLITSGAVPQPADSTIYLLETPPNTDTLCQMYTGYHDFFLHLGKNVVVALVSNCPGQAAFYGTAALAAANNASHEIIEAATDPVSTGYWITDPLVPLGYALFGEVADLCIDYPFVDIGGGYSVTASWSNSAVLAGTSSPCVPAANGPYYSVVPVPAILKAKANQSQAQDLIMELTGWSTGTISGGWHVSAGIYPTGGFTPTLSFANAAITDGQAVPLTVTVPAHTAAGKVGVLLQSYVTFSSKFSNDQEVEVLVE
jgi:hypothetical protein